MTLKTLIISMALVMMAFSYGHGATPFPRGDGEVCVFSYHTGEYEQIKFREKDKYLPDGIKKFEDILRSRDGKVGRIDPRIFDLIDHLGEKFGAETVEVISGYRSPALNDSLIKNGSTAVENSLHIKGRAVDLHIDEVSESDVFEYIKSLKLGGAGLYQTNLFVHADLGEPKSWVEPVKAARVLIGTENNPNNEWAAVTDKNFYSRGDELLLSVTNNSYGKNKLVAGHAYYERFRKGEWVDHDKIELGGKKAKLDKRESAEFGWAIPNDQPFGKYRLVIFPSKKSKPVYSNEFYVRPHEEASNEK